MSKGSELNYKQIGTKIKQRRKEMGKTQEFLADKLGVNSSHISNLERGYAHPSLTILVNIANLLCCSVDYFLHDEYTYPVDANNDSLDDKITEKLRFCDKEKKEKLLKMIDIL